MRLGHDIGNWADYDWAEPTQEKPENESAEEHAREDQPRQPARPYHKSRQLKPQDRKQRYSRGKR